MQGVVISSHAPHMANGEIGVLRPGRNPFHYPTAQTHNFETKELIYPGVTPTSCPSGFSLNAVGDGGISITTSGKAKSDGGFCYKKN